LQTGYLKEGKERAKERWGFVGWARVLNSGVRLDKAPESRITSSLCCFPSEWNCALPVGVDSYLKIPEIYQEKTTEMQTICHHSGDNKSGEHVTWNSGFGKRQILLVCSFPEFQQIHKQFHKFPQRRGPHYHTSVFQNRDDWWEGYCWLIYRANRQGAD
jgi:hypothetical protein